MEMEKINLGAASQPLPGQEQQAPQDTLGKEVVSEVPKNNQKYMKILAGLVVAVLGIGSGWFFSGQAQGSQIVGRQSGSEAILEAGEVDESLLAESESEQGILYEGGANGEGTHYLDRGMGEDKKIYLLSTVIDLQAFVGKNVEIWGNTLAAEHAGWLMDVVRVKVIK